MNQQKIRWGILGTAEIARKSWGAMRNSGNSVLVAVGSRDISKSQRFIDECQGSAPFPTAPVARAGYQSILDDPGIDAVYIPLPTGVRKEWILRAAAAGKHIVSEKPCATSVADLQEILAVCRKNNVQFMDGVMFRHSRRLDAIRKTLEDGESVGTIKRITSAFSFRASEDFFRSNIRTNAELEPLGCLGDLGWYCVQFSLWAMNWEMPVDIRGRLLSSQTQPDGRREVPTEFAGDLQFRSGATASFYCSFLTANQQWAHISGERGGLRVSDFVLPFFKQQPAFEVQNTRFEAEGCKFKMIPQNRGISVHESSEGEHTAQECNLYENFSKRVQMGQIDSSWPEIALKTQTVIEALLNS